MRLRRAALVLGIGAIGISAVLSAQQPHSPSADAERARSRPPARRGRTLPRTGHQRDVTAVIAQEDYLQRVPVEAKFRRLRSDLLIVAEANVGWLSSATRSRSTSGRFAIAITAPPISS